MPQDVSWVAALVAGFFSFTSPCVLPLVPVFLARIAGITGESRVASRGPLVANAAAYVGGFSVVFVLLGVALGAGGAVVSTADVVVDLRPWLVRAGGLLLVVIGLRQLGLIRIPVLDRTLRMDAGQASAAGLGSSFMIGVTFGAGWSPCIGPILGIILTMAASSGDVGRAGFLLVAYSLGLGIPFLLIAATVGSSDAILRGLRRNMGMVVGVSGAIMLGVGLIMLLGIYERLFVEIVRVAPWLPWEPQV
jgi:cytochrome c-type biogenesis protein